ncbi:Hypothetical protein I596_664 [Dokdonella koreensis DS-123]|uniref:Uncharacterized protein n=1 Tax=Dokdonella koreensis DS-123 TaxID=1300342 RepID=A0A161HJD7_9GAMM|nr:Hypothetical protein I596_664 [Dokdonella koreensis DS-123]
MCIVAATCAVSPVWRAAGRRRRVDGAAGQGAKRARQYRRRGAGSASHILLQACPILPGSSPAGAPCARSALPPVQGSAGRLARRVPAVPIRLLRGAVQYAAGATIAGAHVAPGEPGVSIPRRSAACAISISVPGRRC